MNGDNFRSLPVVGAEGKGTSWNFKQESIGLEDKLRYGQGISSFVLSGGHYRGLEVRCVGVLWSSLHITQHSSLTFRGIHTGLRTPGAQL